MNYSDRSDFVVGNKYTFEIGGRSKGKKIRGIAGSIVVKDDIEAGSLNVIPGLFGFLY